MVGETRGNLHSHKQHKELHTGRPQPRFKPRNFLLWGNRVNHSQPCSPKHFRKACELWFVPPKEACLKHNNMAMWRGCRHQIPLTNMYRLQWIKSLVDDHKHDILPVQTCQIWIALTVPSDVQELRRMTPFAPQCFLGSAWQLHALKLEYLRGAVEKQDLRVPAASQNQEKC